VPTTEFPPATPFTLHVTFIFWLPKTLAWNCIGFPVRAHEETGELIMLTPRCGDTVTLTFALFVESATLVAVT
jgi:hypothetical protein